MNGGVIVQLQLRLTTRNGIRRHYTATMQARNSANGLHTAALCPRPPHLSDGMTKAYGPKDFHYYRGLWLNIYQKTHFVPRVHPPHKK